MEVVNGKVMDRKTAFYLFIKMIKLLNVNASIIKMKFTQVIRVILALLDMNLFLLDLTAILIIALIQ